VEKWYFWLEHGRKSGASYFLFFFNGWDKGIPSGFGWTECFWAEGFSNY
jgi:hypothetical protein